MRTVILIALLTLAVVAKPAMYDLVDVPTDKLLAGLEKKAAANPKDAHLQYLLGRVNAIAYAQNSTTFQVLKEDPGRPWFGPMDPGYPPRTVESKGARKRLEQAVAHYRKAIELDPKDDLSRMGLAWCLEESGQRQKAIEQYRKVYQSATKSNPFGPGVREESGRRLLALLDPKQDAAEIAAVKAEVERLAAMPRAVTPVLVPLERGTEFEQLVNPAAAVRFDLDGSGRRFAWGWPTERAGWLVYRDRHDQARSGLQLLGGVTWWVFWKNGYEAMSALDEDGNGWLEGPELEHLHVWCDRDHDGVEQPEEELSLDQLGIVGLSCAWVEHREGFPYSPRGIRYRDGGRGASYDWMPEGRP